MAIWNLGKINPGKIFSTVKDPRKIFSDKRSKNMAQRKCSFVWKSPDGSWTWTATHYEGNGIFFGTVTSPYVPDGEMGTWYYNDIATYPLVKGSEAELDKLLKPSFKNREKQQAARNALGL